MSVCLSILSRAPVTHCQVHPTDRRVKSISCGHYHTGALMYGGILFTWGSGSDGELGHGERNNEVLPKEVRGLVSVEMRVQPQPQPQQQTKVSPAVSSVQVSTPLLFSQVCGGRAGGRGEV